MLHIIGLGLDKESMSVEAKKILKKAHKVYLDTYTVMFPYDPLELEALIGKKITGLTREELESNKIVEEASKRDIALLVYGSPLTATTHISLMLEARKKHVPVKILHNASVLDAIAETGLQLYKFGKIASMPAWHKG